MSADPRIADYIRANRTRYTREAITQRLAAAGHGPRDIEAAWEEVARDTVADDGGPPPAPPEPATTRWILGAFAVIVVLGGFFLLVPWLLYGTPPSLAGIWIGILGVVVIPVIWFSRRRPLGAAAVAAYLLALPIVAALSLVGAGLSGSNGPLVWLVAYVIAGALAVWQAYRFETPRTAAGTILGVLGAVALIALVTGASCLASVPFMNG